MRTGEKLIPKAVLLRALHEILDAARDPEAFATRKEAPSPRTASESRAFALGDIQAAARDALRAAE